MAAFSYQELYPYLVDCVLTPDMIIKLSSPSSSSSTSSNITSPILSPSSCCFSGDHLNPTSNYSLPIFHDDHHLQFQYPYDSLVNFHQNHLNPTGFSLHDTSCAQHFPPLPLLAHTTPASSDNDTTLNGNNTGVQATPVSNKKKPRGDGSKDVRGGRAKKQKKSNNEGVKEEEEEEENDKLQSQEPPKGYIHVRARRGQATDSHSLAERVRREKISERMKLLQSLVPGCDKVTGKASMLDEIINYVQSLQTQVEFLSMKLSSVDPMVYNFGVDLDVLLLGQQVLHNPTLTSVQQCSESSPIPTTETPPTGLATTAGIATVFQQEEERGGNPPCLQENTVRSLYWGVGEDQSGFGNISNNRIMY